MVMIEGSGFHTLAVDLARAGERARPLAETVVQKVTADVERDAKIFAPVDTGALQNSISRQVSTGADTITGEVGPTVNYGAFVEFGTSRMAPRAFLGPALDRNGPGFEKAMGQIIDKAL
ncbi:HK97-gp10 family putative phage morphogenesis protein [Ruania rhizosphaerae]|uniref:HK97-gp10 family putative phage morphogenesis protein n=1 Tax=Ruania rhizosphaerae TaxID=1840413 RepID=UPI001F33A7A2|nr:HK97-gp10 family putative phage morphogenesis protein [Ruania rhizosphaerae]